MNKLGLFFAGLGIIVLACFLTGAIVMLLYNWLIPVLFAKAVAAGWIAGSITYWQGWGLAMLGSILFGKNSAGGSSK